MATSVLKILRKERIEASAPCRMDSGGTWDIKSLALPLENVRPVTINVAVSLRTRVLLSPFLKDGVRIVSEGFDHSEEAPFEALPFDSPFGLFFAAASYFGFHGFQAQISSDSPVKSALGGSSTALVAFIKAMSRMRERLGNKDLSAREILHLGYHLEDAVAAGKCGIQDQAAAVYGGVNLWTWHFGDRFSIYQREPLLDRKAQREMSEHIVLAYSGKSHVSTRINRSWINDFLSSKTRAGWIEANEVVKRLGRAIGGRNWGRAAGLLREEMKIRKGITPDALTPLTEDLIHQAEDGGCGARFTGAGGGGCVWAVGEKGPISELKQAWKAALSSVKGGSILDCSIDPEGVQ
jgi:galactokinase/mevalonate kinase-like predicted kinase